MTPFREALQKHRARQVIGADRSAAEWADVPVGLRDRAFWMARNQNLDFAQQAKDMIDSVLNPQQVRRADRVTPANPEGFVTEGMNPATARAEMKKFLSRIGYQPEEGKAGTIQDLSSDGRLDLVVRQNVDQSFGFGQFLQGQDPDVLDEWPAQELFRAEDRKEPRAWPTRWMQAGGQIFDGRMIALKTDPIWEGISEFDTPWPPFDYNSGMWVRDVSRAEAEELGLLAAGAEVEPTVEKFNAKLEKSVKDIDPDLQQSLLVSMGDQVQIVEGVLKWVQKL